ncbi:response regulator [Clostridium formicaceticum]|uniref:Stage 0 sporulation protein A homolog n=1 Tax=Clostridium formicaceticum TaxID=1497 RepID=A0AAC9WG70_9CLOT|nr:response regulator [Clostridium formicaceticum]AOY77028.1 hypothetical protein BJL90_14915 [Clostridium formicaceticum]ARE87526.1 Hydrogenase transcriptional regulatory protein hupR1 [Clostridium formicaceticum]
MEDMDNKNTVLFVDDEIGVLNALERALFGEAYRCVFASSGMEALKIMEEEAISVIVTDMRMPGMDGLKLLRAVKEKYPDVVKIVLSGYAQISQVLSTINQIDIFKFILKPWDTEAELQPILQKAVEYYNLQQESKKAKDTLEKRNALYQGSLKKVEERLKQHKVDFNNSRRLCNVVMKDIKEIIKEHGAEEDGALEEIIKKIDEMQTLYDSYLEALPLEYDVFPVKRLIEGLTSQMQENDLAYMADIKEDRDKFHNVKCYGNFKLVHRIISYVISYTKKPQFIKKPKILTTIQDGHLCFVISIALIEGEDTAYKKHGFYRDMNMLQEVCKATNLVMCIAEEQQQIVVKIQIPIQS